MKLKTRRRVSQYKRVLRSYRNLGYIDAGIEVDAPMTGGPFRFRTIIRYPHQLDMLRNASLLGVVAPSVMLDQGLRRIVKPALEAAKSAQNLAVTIHAIATDLPADEIPVLIEHEVPPSLAIWRAEELASMSRDQLRVIARQHKIAGYGSMRKSDLAATLVGLSK